MTIVLLDCLFLDDRPGWRRLAWRLPLLATMAVVPLTHLFASGAPQQDLSATVNHLSVAGSASRSEYLLTQFRVVITYLRLLLLPVHQSVDYTYPLYHSLTQPPVMLSLLGLLALLSTALVALRISFTAGNPRGSCLDLRLFSFGIFWFFLTLSVESSLIPIEDLIFEHRTYLPSFGAFLAASVVIHNLITGFCHQERRAGQVQRAFLIAMGMILMIMTYKRNMVWQNSFTLWSDVVAKFPKNARAWNNLGEYHLKQLAPAHAIPYFQKAVDADPRDYPAWYNLGLALCQLGDWPRGLQMYNKALEINPNFTLARTQQEKLNKLLDVHGRDRKL